MIEYFKYCIFPGVNLHARCRYREIPRLFETDVKRDAAVLDAGCGNGMLSYQAWKQGAKVLGISIKKHEIDGCKSMFNQRMRIPDEQLQFALMNLYDFDPSQHQFDVIICTEVLEHIRNDVGICQKFFQILKPGGTVHITCPNADHPYNRDFPLDPDENGGHVRPGYTEQSYRSLLEPIGFQAEEFAGLGGSVRQFFNRRIKETQERFGAWAGVPLFFVAMPFMVLDQKNPKIPFSLYVCARKPAD